MSSPKEVSGRFYIGYKTSGKKFLNVGFDQNNNNSHHVFYRTNADWSNSFYFGTPMLRPVLGKYFEQVSVCERKEMDWGVKIYPNPAKEKLYITLSQEVDVENVVLSIYSITGQKIYESPYTSEVELSKYVSGFYLLQFTDIKQNRSTVRKFLISK